MDLLQEALRDPLLEPPPDLLPALQRTVPAPLSARERREAWRWALAPLAGGALLGLWTTDPVSFALVDLSWLPPLLVAAALHAAGPWLSARLTPKD